MLSKANFLCVYFPIIFLLSEGSNRTELNRTELKFLHSNACCGSIPASHHHFHRNIMSNDEAWIIHILLKCPVLGTFVCTFFKDTVDVSSEGVLILLKWH